MAMSDGIVMAWNAGYVAAMEQAAKICEGYHESVEEDEHTEDGCYECGMATAAEGLSKLIRAAATAPSLLAPPPDRPRSCRS